MSGWTATGDIPRDATALSAAFVAASIPAAYTSPGSPCGRDADDEDTAGSHEQHVRVGGPCPGPLPVDEQPPSARGQYQQLGEDPLLALADRVPAQRLPTGGLPLLPE